MPEFRSTRLIERVERHIGDFLAERGFDRMERRRYRRTNEGVEHWVGVGAYPRRSYVVLDASAAVRFPRVAALLACGGSDDDQILGAFGGLLNLLDARSQNVPADWRGAFEEDSEDLARSIEHELTRTGLPFLERFQRIEEVEARLASSNFRDWVSLDDARRTELRAAILWEMRRGEEALSLLDEQVRAARANDRPPHAYLDAERLAQYLRSIRADPS